MDCITSIYRNTGSYHLANSTCYSTIHLRSFNNFTEFYRTLILVVKEYQAEITHPRIGMGLQKDNRVNDGIYTLYLASVILLLGASSSATYQEITDVSLDGEPGIWKGIPTINLKNQTNLENQTDLKICANDTNWSDDIADNICQYYGFEGSMVIALNDVAESELDDGYAVCMIDTNIESRLQLACEYIDTCWSVPTISCTLPGYQGCYVQSDTSPFINGTTVDLGEGSADVQTCAAACPGNSYLGMTNGTECICGSVLDDSSDQGVCDLPCKGDELQLCGGENSTSVYSSDVIGWCGDGSEWVELIPDQAHYITSPNFPDIYEADVQCTWILNISVDMFHDLEIITTYEFNDDNTTQHLQVSSESGIIEQETTGSSGTIVLDRNPYRTLQDHITVSFTLSEIGSGTGFIMKFTLASRPPTTLPTNELTELTTSKAVQTANLNKFVIAATVGIVFLTFRLM